MTRKENLRQLYPECFFSPKYPYKFKIDLIIGNENFGELEIIVKEDLNIDEIKGDKKVLEKLDEIVQKQAGKHFYLPACRKKVIPYPPKKLNELCGIFTNEEVKANKDFKKIGEFLANTYDPINAELLYEKTGIKIF